jgi:endonuclease YncB( thermonuclease family)
MILVYFHSLTGRVRVRRLWIILSIVMSTAAFAGEFTGKVIGVADGDTITVLSVDGDTKTPVKIRLAGIDTPEKAQDYGAKAKKALSSQIHGKTVKVVYTEKDRYGRTIGDVYWGKRWINLEMVAAGWAYGDVSEVDLWTGRLMFIADAHKDGFRCIAKAETRQTAYTELRAIIAEQEGEG